MNDHERGFRPNTEATIRIIGVKVKEIMVGTVVMTIEKVNMFEMETTTLKTTSGVVSMVSTIIGVDPMFHPKIGKFLLGIVEVVRGELKICCRRL